MALKTYNLKRAKRFQTNRTVSVRPKLTIALVILCLLFSGTATAQDDTSSLYSQKTQALTQQNIEQFLNKTKKISTSSHPDMMPADISDYLTRHIAENSQFASKITYNIPGYAPQTNEMNVDKSEYIASVLKGQNLLRNYTVTTVIDNLGVSNSGRTAKIQTTGTESGEMLWPDDKGNKEYLPMTGLSVCRQDIILSKNNYIQMAGATCKTTIDFAPQNTAPLEKDEFIDDFYDW